MGISLNNYCNFAEIDNNYKYLEYEKCFMHTHGIIDAYHFAISVFRTSNSQQES